MSPFSQPANKPLEQFKVTELKDELRKRGLSLKGVKKELFDRLEEAIRKEVEVAGIPSGEPVFSGGIQTVKADILTDTHEVKVDAHPDVNSHHDAKVDAHPDVNSHHDAKVDAHVDVDTHGDVRGDPADVDVKVDPHVDTHGDAKLDPYADTQKVGAHVDTRQDEKVGTHVDTRQDEKVDAHVDTHHDVKVDAHMDTHHDVKVDAHIDTRQDVKSHVHMDTRENQDDDTASASGIILQMKETSSEYGYAPEGLDFPPKGLDNVAVGNDGIVLTEDLESVQGRPIVTIVEVEHPAVEPPHGENQAQEAEFSVVEPLLGQVQAKYSVVDPPHGQEQAQKAEYPVVDPQEVEHILVDPTHPLEARFPGVDPSHGQVNEFEYPLVNPPHGQEAKSPVVDPYHGEDTEEAESPAVDLPHGQLQSEEAPVVDPPHRQLQSEEAPVVDPPHRQLQSEEAPVVDPPHGQEETHGVNPAHGEVQTEEAKFDPCLEQIAAEREPFIPPLELVKSAEASYDEEMPEASFMDVKMEEVEHFTSQPTTPEHMRDLPDGFDLDESDRLLIQGSFLDTKVKQVETETQPEVKPAVVSDGHRQMEVEQEKPKRDHSKTQKYGGEHIRLEGRAGGLSNEVDLKSADAESHDDACPKRKYNEREMKHQEPAKRMRRWNSGNSLMVEVSEPLTTDTVKEIMSAEVKEGKSTPKVSAASRSFTQPVVRAERAANGENNGKRQVVPAPTRPPTTSLKIERFIRPFTLKAVKDLLAEYGCCVDFWMDQIKTHCYVTYSAKDEAIAARNALYGRQWPSTFGNQLVAEFVDGQEVKIRCEGLPETVNVSPVTTPHGRPSLAPSQAAAVHTSKAPLPSPPPSRERHALPPLRRELEPAIPTLDDLFKKTKAKPHIYFLALTDEQVAVKLAVKTKEQQSKFSAPVRT